LKKGLNRLPNIPAERRTVSAFTAGYTGRIIKKAITIVTKKTEARKIPALKKEFLFDSVIIQA
jgi:hypothetical protein